MATIDLIVLGILKKESMSAYDIQKLVEYRNISKWVKISTPSIYKKVIQLEEKGYIIKRRHSLLLTAKGEELAERIYERHQYFKRLLLLAGVKEENAEQDACLMEHVLCEESYEKLKKYLEKMIGTQEAGQ